uniref:Uncharacterized protein n=1 Tax=Panagrolaimus sp. PS1159 TaxID=55785 RepID=A0AC35F255_9BILA
MPNSLVAGRQIRAESVGVCLGLSDHEKQTFLSAHGGGDPNSPGGASKIRRRSTRRRLSQVQKAINFCQWANKRQVFV